MISVLALVIDRRSFLSAAIAYLGIMLSWVIETDNTLSAAAVLIILGLFVTAIGTWWVPLRSALMRRLPDFPGKQRLPPYAEKA
jgi:apolipoprotein N-acyltransferase